MKETTFNIPKSFLAKINEASRFAYKGNKTRSAENVLLHFTSEGLRIVATDNHCLVKHTCESIKSKKEQKVLFDKELLSVFKKALKSHEGDYVAVNLYEKKVSFCFEDVEFIAHTNEPFYPNYQPLADTPKKTAIAINKKSILEIIKQKTLKEKNKHTIELSVRNDGVWLALFKEGNPLVLKRTECECEEKGLAVRFGLVFFLKCLNSIKSNDVILYTTDKFFCFLCDPKDTNATFIVAKTIHL